MIEHGLGLRLTICAQRSIDLVVFVCQDRRCQQRGIDGASTTDRERADRNARRHLRNRQQGVDAVERLRLNGNAKYRQLGFSCGHSG